MLQTPLIGSSFVEIIANVFFWMHYALLWTKLEGPSCPCAAGRSVPASTCHTRSHRLNHLSWLLTQWTCFAIFTTRFWCSDLLLLPINSSVSCHSKWNQVKATCAQASPQYDPNPTLYRLLTAILFVQHFFHWFQSQLGSGTERIQTSSGCPVIRITDLIILYG